MFDQQPGLRQPFLQQALAVLGMGLRTIRVRPGPSLIIIVGIAGVVAVTVALFAMARGFETTVRTTGQADRALVLRAGSTSEINGNIPIGQYSIIRAMPQVARDGGDGIASMETFVSVNLARHSAQDASVTMRGAGAQSFDVRPELRIVQGQRFEPGRYQLIAGVRAAAQFRGLEVGSSIAIRGIDWQVVGHFVAAGAAESELWVDERLLAQAWKRGETFSSMLARLRAPEAFEAFRQGLASDRRLTVTAHRESDFYAAQAEPTSRLIRSAGALVGTIMAIGAVFAALNTMHAALRGRAREIATLRALGFARGAVLLAVVAEAVILSVVGAALALAVVFVTLQGETLSTVAAASTSNSQVAFRFLLDWQSLLLAAVLAVGLGALGGLVPGLGAVRRPIPRALRGI